jgi:hypothetical protein
LRPGRRVYGEAVREALILLWEASDRVCGKRLKALLPVLITAMERQLDCCAVQLGSTSLHRMPDQ